ncbi:unannotated protein [freshwater metagenome]|uniref:Unannotated protein n=1 Tax=freshwater metagenome TaxID=449393 RepID=A0A6J7C685_9ZZZZ
MAITAMATRQKVRVRATHAANGPMGLSTALPPTPENVSVMTSRDRTAALDPDRNQPRAAIRIPITKADRTAS